MSPGPGVLSDPLTHGSGNCRACLVVQVLGRNVLGWSVVSTCRAESESNRRVRRKLVVYVSCTPGTIEFTSFPCSSACKSFFFFFKWPSLPQSLFPGLVRVFSSGSCVD